VFSVNGIMNECTIVCHTVVLYGYTLISCSCHFEIEGEGSTDSQPEAAATI